MSSLANVQEGTPRDIEFSEETKAKIRQIQEIFNPAMNRPYEEWEHGFKCDQNHDREIQIWLDYGAIFTEITQGKLTPSSYKEHFSLLLLVMANGITATRKKFEFQFISRNEGKKKLKLINERLTAKGYDTTTGIPLTVVERPAPTWPRWMTVILAEAINGNYKTLRILKADESRASVESDEAETILQMRMNKELLQDDDGEADIRQALHTPDPSKPWNTHLKGKIVATGKDFSATWEFTEEPFVLTFTFES